MGQTAPRRLRRRPALVSARFLLAGTFWRSESHVVIAHEHDRRVRVFQPCLMSVNRAPGNEGKGGLVATQKGTDGMRPLFIACAASRSSRVRGGVWGY